MSIEVFSIELIEDPADPRSPKKRQSLIRAMILRQTATDHKQMDAEADTALTRTSVADQSYEDWNNVGDGGTAQGRELKNVRLKEARAAKDSAIAALKKERGDYKDKTNNPPPPIEDTAPPESQAAPAQTPPPVVIEQAIGAGRKRVNNLRAKRKTWRDIAFDYVVEIYRTGKYRTAHVFYVALVNKAGRENSLFTLHDRELFLAGIGQSVSEKTIANAMKEIKTAARQVKPNHKNPALPAGNAGE